MTFLTLAETIPLVWTAQQRGDGAVVVTVARDSRPAGLPAGARLVVLQDGSVQGSFGPVADATMRNEALKRLAAGESGSRTFEERDGALADAGARSGPLDVFFEVLARPASLIIVGAGHIAVPLARIAATLDFHVTVLDDRPEFATRDRFPDATDILIGPYRETLAGVPIDSSTHVVLVTRGHVHDQACLEQIIESDAAYIGMIGSKRRVRTVLRRIKEQQDIPDEFLARVNAPVGLDIGARTPAEIALAIVGEIVNQRRHGHAPSLALGERLRV